MSTIAQWNLMSAGPDLRDGVPVTLRNQTAKRSLRFGGREEEVALVWDNATNLDNFSVVRQQVNNGPVTYGAQVAFRFDTGGFLRYAERQDGINLGWSDSEHFEWEITGGQPGEVVPLNRPVALLNTVHGDHLIYDERQDGISLRWYADFGISRNIPGSPFTSNQLMFGGYPPLPIPSGLRAPGREAAQIQITGEARRMTIFHGRVDDELDWHVYVSVNSVDRRVLTDHLRNHARGGEDISEDDLDQQYCELMVLDGYNNKLFDELFYSADVTRAFGLLASAWEISEQAGDSQGNELNATHGSHLTRRGARVSLQGPYVNDAAHGFRPEIHPLDSIAYAIAADGTPLSIPPDDPRWPDNVLTWRVGVFTNSTFHRISAADYLKQERTVTWLLELPRDDLSVEPATSVFVQTTVTATEPGFTNRSVGAQDLDDARPTAEPNFARYGVASEEHALTPRNSEGRRFLRVTVRMYQPDRWGGMFLADYRIRVGPPLIHL